MIYDEKYRVIFYRDSRTSKEPVLDYFKRLDAGAMNKVNKYVEFLSDHGGYIDYPYGRHIKGKIRELRVDFFNCRHRILYFTILDRRIILLSAFLKKTAKTPTREIAIAEKRYSDTINNLHLYD